jgi:hypothetical protein
MAQAFPIERDPIMDGASSWTTASLNFAPRKSAEGSETGLRSQADANGRAEATTRLASVTRLDS